jgi:micrococcal nuclease
VKYLIPLLFIIFGYTVIYAYQHRTPEVVKQTPVVPITPTAQQSYKVTKVIDGDTLQVQSNGTTETVRLIGVDTPETVDPRKPVQCYGPEASAETKRLLEGKQVTLEADPSQGDRDKYGRLLRYVYWFTNTEYLLVNEALIFNGFGREYTYDNPYQYQKLFKASQDSAQANKRGLWGACN